MPKDVSTSTILVGALLPLGIAGGTGRLLALSRNSTEWLAGILVAAYFLIALYVQGVKEEEEKKRNKSGDFKPE